MESALVSIITPTYNSEKFISATIQSVQNQHFQNWEMIIIDDGSTDKTLEIIASFRQHDNRIKLQKLAVNSGAGVARNKGVEMASGRYIAFLDSDDLWKPEKLEKQINFLHSNRLAFTFSFYDCIDESENVLNKRITAPKLLTYKQLFYCNFVGNLTGIYDVEYFGKIPISNLRKRQDWMVWLTILKKIKTAKPVPESLAFYRVRNDSISASKLGLLKSNYNVYRKFHKFNILLSVCCLIGFLWMQLLIKPRYIKKIKTSVQTV